MTEVCMSHTTTDIKRMSVHKSVYNYANQKEKRKKNLAKNSQTKDLNVVPPRVGGASTEEDSGRESSDKQTSQASVRKTHTHVDSRE